MGRKSNLEIAKDFALGNLAMNRNKFDARTYASIQSEILQKNTVNKVNIVNDRITRVAESVNPTKITRNIFKGAKKVNASVKAVPVRTEVIDGKRVYKKRTDEIKFVAKYLFKYAGIANEEELYEKIKKEQDALGKKDMAYAVVFLNNKENPSQPRAVSIDANYMVSYELFQEFLNNVNDIVPGSDAVRTDQWEINLDEFGITTSTIAGLGKSEDMIFEVEGITESKRDVKGRKVGNGDCAFQCLLRCIEKDSDEYTDLMSVDRVALRDIDNIKMFINKHDLRIDMICNSFLMNRRMIDITSESIKNKTFIQKRINGRVKICSKINLDVDVRLAYLIGNGCGDYTMIYDEINQHYDLIKNNEIKFCDDVLLTADCSLLKGEKILFKPRDLNVNNMAKADEKVEKRFIFYDYETVVNFERSRCVQEYSLSILNLSNYELERLTDADEKGDMDVVNEIRERSCITFLGYDCSIKFINWIIDNQDNKAFVFIGFNNSNFDNFILLDALLKSNNRDMLEYRVSDIFYNGNQLLNFYLNGRHNTFDIHKHLMGSLKANCESFKIKCCAKKSFDHNKAQQLYLNGELLDFITGNDELKEYNEFDVLATAVLFCKYRKALAEIPATANYAKELETIKTVGSLIYKVFEDSKKKKAYNLPKLSFQQYDDLQKSKIAGRVELFNGVQKVLERLVSTDVCSLYPFVMSVLDVYYPCGELVEVEEYKGADVIGFYYCDIDQSNLRARNLPKIYARKTKIENDWGHEEVLENYLISNVMIELLRKYECGVVIRNGFIFTEKKKSCDMFDFLLDFMKAKNEQDTLKSKKDEKYNSALRETLKLLMNSLSGKVIEGLHTEKTCDIDNLAEFEKLKEKSKSINCINTIGNKIFVSYEVEGEKLIKKQRPIYLGVLIYDYAKRYMFENSYSKVGLKELLYTDTDASKFRYKKFLEWKDWVDKENIQVPHWKEVELIDDRYKNHKIYESGSKVFGSFEDELEDSVGTDYAFYCLEKKSWCYAVDGKAKFRFKGLNGKALILSLGEDFIERKTINHKSKDGKDAWQETKMMIKKDSDLQVYNYAMDNKHLEIENKNELKFFEQIYSTGEAYLLCNSFRKIVKNSGRNVGVGDKDRFNGLMNSIQVNYTMKHINLYKK